MSNARFVVKEKRVKLDVRAAAIDAGTDSACALVLADEIAAPRHCTFARAGAGFVVRDLGTDTGTYRNGLRVTGDVPLADGDEVIAGTTRLRVSIRAAASERGGTAAGEPTLELQLVAGDLAFQPSGAGVFDSDPDRWARSEADLARWPALRHANLWAARVLVVGLPLLLLWPRAREALTDPGPLSASHAALFTATGELSRAQALAQEQGCGVCHDAFGGTPDERCAQCHADLHTKQHPFASRATDRATVLAPLAADSCARCHQEHHGPQLDRTGGRKTPELCRDCHRGTEVERRGFTTERPAEAVATAPQPYGGYAFAHQDHAAIDCTHCHRRPEPDPRSADRPARPGSEFARVEFALCSGCHRRDAPPAPVPAQWRPARAENVWTIAWHAGDDDAEHCGQCHREGPGARGFGPEFRETTRPATDASTYAERRARYDVAPRSHGELFADGDRDCARCHRDGTRTARAAERTFWHEMHLATALATLTTDAARAAASAACNACHGDLARARGLTDVAAGAYACATDAACGACHREGGRDEPTATAGLRVPRPKPAADLPLRQRIDFPHAAHTDFTHEDLAAGCFACHEFTPTKAGAPFAVPTTKPDAMRCMPCHDQHDNVGGGACRRCHGTAEADTYNDFLGRSPPKGRQQVPRPWPIDTKFDHFSRGHAASTRESCATCHRDASAPERAQTLSALQAPTEADRVCRDCHLRDRERFHWR